MSKLKELLTVERERKLISNTCKYPSAIEMIRCGIGSNYGGVYYDEVIAVVLDPIKSAVGENDYNEDFDKWLREECFQKPTDEAYELAKCAWNKALEIK